MDEVKEVGAKPALSDFRVLELADEKGTYAGKELADMGADVIKIERPGGDRTRSIPPFFNDRPHPDGSLYFLYMNTNKRGITLNLATDEGRALFRRLVDTADVFIETCAPGYLDGLGLSYEALAKDNPGLIMTSVTNFGQTGPYKDYKASDIVGYAMGGLMYVTGYDDAPPLRAGGSQAYMMAGVQAGAATMMALFARRTTRGGLGQHIDISMQEAVAALTNLIGVSKYLDDKVLPVRAPAKGKNPFGNLRCKDGGYVCITVARARMWPVLASWVAEVTGNRAILNVKYDGPAINRQIHADELGVLLAEFAARLDKDDLYREGQRRRLAVAPVNGPKDLAESEHLGARHFYVEVDHPHTGRLTYPGAPFNLSETPWAIRRPAPMVGQHNREVFVDELGLSMEEMKGLAKKGVI